MLEEVENLLIICLSNKQSKGDSISEIICARAGQLYGDVQTKAPSTRTEETPAFLASRG